MTDPMFTDLRLGGVLLYPDSVPTALQMQRASIQWRGMEHRLLSPRPRPLSNPSGKRRSRQVRRPLYLSHKA